MIHFATHGGALMTAMYRTRRGRLICVMVAALIAGFSLGYLWWMSPTVTADDHPLPKLTPPRSQPVYSDPPRPAPPLPDISVKNPSTPDVPQTNPTTLSAPSITVAGSRESNPSSPPPPPPVGALVGAALTPKPVAPPQQPVTAESQEIKQLMNQLSQIRADRDKLNLQEQQTILTIKQKVLEQKRALEQLARIAPTRCRL